jgi:hypothetical protein
MVRRRGVFAGLCVSIVLVLASQAWGCVFGPSVFLNTSTIKPGESVMVEGLNFRPDIPVVARMSTLDGPVLAEFGPPEGDRRRVYGPVTIPAGTQPGNYVIVFTQAGTNGAAQVPTRALVSVIGQGGSAPTLGAPVGVADDPRATRVETESDSVTAPTLLLFGFGAAGIAMFLGGIAAAAARRAPSAPQPERATASPASGPGQH